MDGIAYEKSETRGSQGHFICAESQSAAWPVRPFEIAIPGGGLVSLSPGRRFTYVVSLPGSSRMVIDPRILCAWFKGADEKSF